MRLWKKKIDWSKFTKPSFKEPEVDNRSYPYEELVTRSSGKISNRDFSLRRTVYKDRIEIEKDTMIVALLMDIRDRLDALVEGINKNIEK